MPFSRSRSVESMTRSATSWFSRNEPGLPEHRVDERRLAVVDVGDDGDVAQVVAAAEAGLAWTRPARVAAAAAR